MIIPLQSFWNIWKWCECVKSGGIISNFPLTAWTGQSQLQGLEVVQRRTQSDTAPQSHTFSVQKHSRGYIEKLYHSRIIDSRMVLVKISRSPVRCEVGQAAAWGRPGFFSLKSERNQPGKVPVRRCSSHPDPEFPDSWLNEDVSVSTSSYSIYCYAE